ncbi:hypothetical protein B5X24_HaOG217126 [Helicoverpa armigera]|uniref:PHD-type domain-containing protein n=1 Tax=Helicoverpa armigera TaxID=29058 RepID=A0A2W1C110_HELAM|nr:hypothetical protein B5X24_HaOG217126 [Helicoverpa armigera]
MALCAGCEQMILNNNNLRCTNCDKNYDLECANIPKIKYDQMNSQQKSHWECQECRCKKPKNNNTNTPARPQHDVSTTFNISPEANVTLRRKPSKQSHDDTIQSEEEISIIGDTIPSANNIESERNGLSLQTLSEMISLKLKENNISIVSEIKTIIQGEINKAVLNLREEFKTETNNLAKQNEQRKKEIENISVQIEQLKSKTETLKNELKALTNAKNAITTQQPTQQPSESNVKRIVLYGLTEIYRETEEDLHDRIRTIFWDILGVDVYDYIEETYRIGRYHKRNRPLVIELMSKKMAKYIVQNYQWFHNTGLYISEYLDEEARSERKILRDKMLVARNMGQNAVIRNNRLYIEGQLINLGNETTLGSTANRKSELHNNNTFQEVNDDRTFRKQRPTF